MRPAARGHLPGGRLVTAALDLEAVISVAEESMERAWLAGRTIEVPRGHVDDPAYRAAIEPLERWLTEVVGQSMTRRIYTSDYTLQQAGSPQALVTSTGSIVTRPTTNELTILHECAHLATRTRHGRGGHTREFVEAAADLYRRWLSPEAAQQFLAVVGASSAFKTAKPNVVPIFNGTGEKNYAYNDPYVVVAYMGPLVSDRLNEVNDLKVKVPWDSDLRDAIREAEKKAERYFAEEPYKGWADKSGYYLVFGSGNTTVAVGHTKHLGDAWRALHGKVGYTEADPSYLRILDRPKDAFAKFCKEIADSQPPGWRQHPLADADVVTIYRGIGLSPGQDPATSDKGDNGGFGKGAGSSWTLDLSVAKAIAERGGAGFSGENNRFGRPRSVKADPSSRYNNTRAVVLRAAVDLSQEGFGLLNDGRMYYSSEQEVDVRPGTEFTLTGWLEAEQIPVDRHKMQQAIEKAKADIAANGYSLEDYEVTYRWPSSWHTTNIKRVAGLDNDLMAFLFAEYRDPARSRGECVYAARKFWDWATREGLQPRTLGFLGLPASPEQEHAASAVQVDGQWVVVDFTFNQFDPDAPWPLVQPLEEYARRWGEWRVTRGRPIAAGHRPGGRVATVLS